MLTYQDLALDQWVTLLKHLKKNALSTVNENVIYISDLINLPLSDVYDALEPELDNYPHYDEAINLAVEDGYKWYNLTNEEKLHYLAETDIQHWELHDKLIYHYKWFNIEKFITPVFIKNVVVYTGFVMERREYINEKIKDLFGEE